MEWRNSSSEHTPEEDSCTSQSLAAKHSKMYQSNTSVEVLCCYANLVILISKNYRMHYTGSRTHLHTRYTGSRPENCTDTICIYKWAICPVLTMQGAPGHGSIHSGLLTTSSAILAGQMHLSIQQHPSVNTGEMCMHSISTWVHMHNPTSPGSSSPYHT